MKSACEVANRLETWKSCRICYDVKHGKFETGKGKESKKEGREGDRED